RGGGAGAGREVLDVQYRPVHGSTGDLRPVLPKGGDRGGVPDSEGRTLAGAAEVSAGGPDRSVCHGGVHGVSAVELGRAQAEEENARGNDGRGAPLSRRRSLATVRDGEIRSGLVHSAHRPAGGGPQGLRSEVDPASSLKPRKCGFPRPFF